MDFVLNVNQVFQLAALGPCAFIILYIIISSSKPSQSILPVLFFVSLSGIFLFPILGSFPEFEGNRLYSSVVLLNEELLPAISFLLILQLTLSRLPPPLYFLVFAIPLIGGGSFTYLSTLQDSICPGDVCYSTSYLTSLYGIFGASLMFMLLVLIVGRSDISISKRDKNRQHKYWLIITLVALNLLFIGVDLARVAGELSQVDANFAKTMIGVGFVYVVLSSIFRVFSESLGIKPWRLKTSAQIAKDRWLSERITWILREEAPYRNLGFNRKAMADLLGVKEHNVSRVINERFGKSFSELMNECRIHDAKKALRDGSDPVTVISFDSGFSSITSFNRVFKEATGVSPSEYRRAANDSEVQEF